MIGQNSSSSFYCNWLNWWTIGDEDWGELFIQQCTNNLMNWLASIMFGFEQMFWALLSILRHFKSPLQFSRVMAHSCFDKVKSWFLSKNFKVFPNAAPLSSSQCYLLRSRRIRRREKLFLALKGFGHFMFARNRISPTWEVEKDWIHHFHAVIQAQ